jgi:sugar phosphate isomerase/epimerase
MVPLVHLCDASPAPSQDLSEDELRRESRTARLLPGEGSLWLDELLDALGSDAHISVEAPSARYAHLPAAERARLASHATQAVLARRNQ